MKSIEKNQIKFYKSKFIQFGDSPLSLAWNDKITQELRFSELTQLFKNEKSKFSIHEIGCGLGHLREYLKKNNFDFLYSGSDIVPEFIYSCKKKFIQDEFTIQNIFVDFDQIRNEVKGKDFYCASGIFNPIGNSNLEQWENFVFKSISNMFGMAKKGIAFNFLSKNIADYHESGLYYSDPMFIFDWCTKNLCRFVNLSHSLPLYEFFIFVFKEDYVKSLFFESEFKKYFKKQ